MSEQRAAIRIWTNRAQWLARNGFGVVDAGVSSLGNLAVSIVAARTLSLAHFGLMSATMLSGLILVGASRAFAGDPLTLRYSAAEVPERRVAAEEAVSASLTVGLSASPVVTALVGVIILVAGGGARDALFLGLSLAVMLPLLVCQELLRAVAYTSHRPFAAFANTLSWTISIVLVLAVLYLMRVPLTAPGFIIVWGLSAGVGVIVGLLLNRVRPGLGRVRSWVVKHAVLSRRLVVDFVLTQVTAEGSFVIISMMAGASEAGLLRKAQIPLSPIVILTSGIALITQPALVRQVAKGSSRKAVAWLVYRIGLLTAALSVGLGLLASALPTRLMTEVIGDEWDLSRRLVPIIAIYQGFGAIAACQGIALRAMDRIAAQVRLRLYSTPVALGIILAASLFGARGAAFGLVLTLLLVVLGWAWLLAGGEPPGFGVAEKPRENGE